MTGGVEIAKSGRVQILRFSRPDKKNAITGAMYEALAGCLEAGEADTGIAAHLFCGSNGIFTAGNDIGDFLATAQGTGGLGAGVLRFLKLLVEVQKPLIAAVDGKAVGVGTTMLLHCDLVYASPTASFSTPFLDLGLIPEAASSLLMPRLMGPQWAFEMLALGAAFPAERALSAGFVNAVLPADRLEAVALEAAHRLAAKPPEALAIARRLLRGSQEAILTRIDEEAALFKARLSSPEARQAFQNFFEKRRPA